MNSASQTPLYRSEAFAEDVLDLVAHTPAFEPLGAPARWVVNAVPVVVALLGLAFAVVPPLT
jgi:hypothetical protein